MKIIATFEPAGAFVTLDELRAFADQLAAFPDTAQVHLSPRKIEVVHDAGLDDEADEPDEGRTGEPGESFGPAARSGNSISVHSTGHPAPSLQSLLAAERDRLRNRGPGNTGVRSLYDFAIDNDGRVQDFRAPRRRHLPRAQW